MSPFLIFWHAICFVLVKQKQNKMEALELQYNSLKDLAKSLMQKGNLKEYFRIISRANQLQLRILEHGLRTSK